MTVLPIVWIYICCNVTANRMIEKLILELIYEDYLIRFKVIK